MSEDEGIISLFISFFRSKGFDKRSQQNIFDLVLKYNKSVSPK